MSKTRRKKTARREPRERHDGPTPDAPPEEREERRPPEETSPEVTPPEEFATADEQPEYRPATGCLLRVFWIMLGNLTLLFCGIYIAQHATGLVGVADAFYGAIVGSLLLARYVDIRHFQGRTAEGEPASMTHWRRYAVLLVAVSTGIWVAAHLAAHFSA